MSPSQYRIAHDLISAIHARTTSLKAFLSNDVGQAEAEADDDPKRLDRHRQLLGEIEVKVTELQEVMDELQEVMDTNDREAPDHLRNGVQSISDGKQEITETP